MGCDVGRSVTLVLSKGTAAVVLTRPGTAKLELLLNRWDVLHQPELARGTGRLSKPGSGAEDVTSTLKNIYGTANTTQTSHKSNFNSRSSLQHKNAPAYWLLQHINRKCCSAAAINTSGTVRFRIQMFESIK